MFNNSGDWKLAPPMNHLRTSPQIIVKHKYFVYGIVKNVDSSKESSSEVSRQQTEIEEMTLDV